MATIAEVADALAGQLYLATGVRATPYVPDSISPPAAFVNVTEIVEETYEGSTLITADLIVLVSRTTARVGVSALFEYMATTGTRSVWEAIAVNPDLNLGDGTQAVVRRYRSLGVEEIAAYGYLGGAFETQVTTPQ